MGINLETQSQSFGVDDQSWLATMKGMNTCRTGTLNLALFTVDHALNGFIPSGTVVGLVTASGLYGPYDDTAADGRQTARGLIFSGVQTSRFNGPALTKAGFALFWEGVVKMSKLPNFLLTANGKGEIDAAGIVDLPTIRWEA